jgi:glutamate-ammonia-ligase adenylyltransferase
MRWQDAAMSPFPKPRDRAAARRLREAFPHIRDGDVGDVLDCLGGNSPYLADLARRDPDTLLAICAEGPDAVCDRALSRLGAVGAHESREMVAAEMRAAKRAVALAAAIADIGGAWTLEQVTGTLSDLADGALRLTTAHLLLRAHDRGDLRLPHPAAPSRGSGFAVLAMGKLGARELNFSSDVDLVLIYDSAALPYTEAGVGATFTRLARDLVSLMQQRDANGYVFRTDLRLRPDPGSTPLAVSLSTALAYYEASALTWERAAMIKARPVAGDLALGRRFLDAIKPVIWRRHLDFAAIADIRTMKSRMDGHIDAALPMEGTAETRLLGHDLKLGEGGIREIEFCAQTLQLVWGGRNPSLRLAPTLPALEAAAKAGHLPGAAVEKLSAAYVFLRRAEHRLQMVADRQTHRLPETAEGFADFAHFFGFRDEAGFATEAFRHLKRVHQAFDRLLEKPADPPDLAYADPQAQLPHAPPGEAAPWVAWLEGRPRALRTERARELLRELLPSLAAVVAQQPHPALVWRRLDDLIYRLPAGVQIFSMLRHHPALLERLAVVLGAAPSLAEHLASVPSALEGLFSPQDIDHDPGAALAAQLTDSDGLDQALGIATRFVRGEEFRLATAELDGRIDQDEAGLARTELADAAITQLLPLVLAEHERRYGKLRGGGLVVVALGKAGSQEMMAGSDLDLMLVYDHPEAAGESSGRTRLPASQYYARAAQAVVAALTVPTRDGKLYEVDMRLRPSGNKGPVAVSLSALARYHRESAWTWERLALTRARVVAGPPRLRAKVSKALHNALAEGDRARVAADTVAMRRRLLAELPPHGPWDVKLRRGGLLEVEFLAQALQLLQAQQRGILNPTTRCALRNLSRMGVLTPDEGDELIRADQAWRACQGLLRICEGRTVPAALAAPLEARVLHALDRILGSQPGRCLAERLQAVADGVSAAFVRHLGAFSSP